MLAAQWAIAPADHTTCPRGPGRRSCRPR
ncbi:hypothetical protein [Streptomyces hawaiiensis]